METKVTPNRSLKNALKLIARMMPGIIGKSDVSEEGVIFNYADMTRLEQKVVSAYLAIKKFEMAKDFEEAEVYNAYRSVAMDRVNDVAIYMMLPPSPIMADVYPQRA